MSIIVRALGFAPNVRIVSNPNITEPYQIPPTVENPIKGEPTEIWSDDLSIEQSIAVLGDIEGGDERTAALILQVAPEGRRTTRLEGTVTVVDDDGITNSKPVNVQMSKAKRQ